MMEMVPYLSKRASQTKPSSMIVQGDLMMREIAAELVLQQRFCGKGDEAVVAEVIMVWKYCEAF
jgi:hypothetical protein